MRSASPRLIPSFLIIAACFGPDGIIILSITFSPQLKGRVRRLTRKLRVLPFVFILFGFFQFKISTPTVMRYISVLFDTVDFVFSD